MQLNEHHTGNQNLNLNSTLSSQTLFSLSLLRDSPLGAGWEYMRMNQLFKSTLTPACFPTRKVIYIISYFQLIIAKREACVITLRYVRVGKGRVLSILKLSSRSEILTESSSNELIQASVKDKY
jgi:hypothetical protein